MDIDTIKNEMFQFRHKCCFWLSGSNGVSRKYSQCRTIFTKTVLSKTFPVRI